MLVVDDNEVQRNLVRDMLTPLGFTVSTASGGRDCLSFAEREKPNLIFLDIAMPEMDGWQVAQRLRQSSPERTAIVVLSANAIDPGRLVDAERLHDDYLMKPIDLRQLLKTIHALLNIEWIYEPQDAFIHRTREDAADPVAATARTSTSSSTSARSGMSGEFRKSWPGSSARHPNTHASSIRCASS